MGIEFSLPPCVSSYENPCPMFDPKDKNFGKKPSEDGLKIDQELPLPTLEFNLCVVPDSCHCDVTAKTTFWNKKCVVAGEDKRFNLIQLNLQNSGAEASPVNRLEVTIDPSKYNFLGVDQGNCQGAFDVSVCSLPFLDVQGKNLSERFFDINLELKSGYKITSDIVDIPIELKLTSECKGETNIWEETVSIPVHQHWRIKVEQSEEQAEDVYDWESDDDEAALEADLSYDVFNAGPSMTQESIAYIFLPAKSKHKGLIKDVSVTYDDSKCELGDEDYHQRPPPPIGSVFIHAPIKAADKEMVIDNFFEEVSEQNNLGFFLHQPRIL